MNLKKGCPSLAPCPDGLPPWDTGQAKRANSSVTERNDSSADSRKVEVLLNKTASAPASLDLCGRLSVGGAGCQHKRIDDAARPDQETSL